MTAPDHPERATEDRAALEAAAREIESITSPLFADEILAIMRRHGLRGPEAKPEPIRDDGRPLNFYDARVMRARQGLEEL